MKLRTIVFGAIATLGAHTGNAAELSLPSGMRIGSMPVKSMKDLRFQATLRQQYDFSCGSAALATLLTHHYATPTSEQDAFKSMFLSGDQQKIRREGFSLLDMQRFLKSRGFTANGFQLPLDKLIEAKLPAIVLNIRQRLPPLRRRQGRAGRAHPARRPLARHARDGARTLRVDLGQPDPLRGPRGTGQARFQPGCRLAQCAARAAGRWRQSRHGKHLRVAEIRPRRFLRN
jgi:hypothetical protein